MSQTGSGQAQRLCCGKRASIIGEGSTQPRWPMGGGGGNVFGAAIFCMRSHERRPGRTNSTYTCTLRARAGSSDQISPTPLDVSLATEVGQKKGGKKKQKEKRGGEGVCVCVYVCVFGGLLFFRVCPQSADEVWGWLSGRLQSYFLQKDSCKRGPPACTPTPTP